MHACGQVGKKLVDFNPAIDKSEALAAIGKEVVQFLASYDMPGLDPATRV